MDGLDEAEAVIPKDIRTKYPHAYRRKSRLELLRMCLGVIGIDFCYAAETAFVSPTMLKLQVPVAFMTWAWVIPPLLGMIFNPLLGSLSDRCRSPLGRRRPFILAMTVGATLGLLLVPNGYDLGQLFGDKCNVMASTNVSNVTIGETWNHTGNYNSDNKNMCHVAIVLTVLGLFLMDFSCDGTQSPFRTYVIDLCVPDDHVRGLTTFTIISGLGGAAGYLTGGINWEAVIGSTSFFTQLRVVFGTALVIHIICILLSVTSFPEIPLDAIEAADNDGNAGTTMNGYGAVELESKEKTRSESTSTTFLTYVKSIFKMPASIFWVCAANFFLWMSVVTYALYFTDFVGQAVYHGSPDAPANTEESRRYLEGVRLGSFAMATYAATCSVYSIFIEKLVDKFGLRTVYILGPVASIVGTAIIAGVRDVIVVILLSPTMGMAYGTLFTMPYIVITQYHEQGMFDGNGQTRGIGTDVALVTSMLFLAQITISLCMGALVYATGSTVTIMVTASVTMAIGVLLTTKITFLSPKTEKK